MKRFAVVFLALVSTSLLLMRCSGNTEAAVSTCPSANVAYAVDSTNNLVCFSLTTPGTIAKTSLITGMLTGETTVAMDFRTVDSGLYALGSTGRLYSLNTASGAATLIGSQVAYAGATAWGFDYNPSTTVDRMRVQTDNTQNSRVNPATGVQTADVALTYIGGDPNAGATPNIVASAYSNNTLNAATTVLYVIDKNLDILAIQNPPNNGTLTTVGSLGINTDNDTSFDIVTNGATNIAYAVLTPAAGLTSSLYTVNLTSGAVSVVGAVGGGFAIRAFSVGM